MVKGDICFEIIQQMGKSTIQRQEKASKRSFGTAHA